MIIFKKKKLTRGNSYVAEARCVNCGHEQDFKIPKGKISIEYVNKIKCDYCECSYWRVTTY